MPRRDKQKLGLLTRREDIHAAELDKAIRAARQRVAMIVHGAAREKGLIVSGRNREALYAKIGQVYLQLDNGLKDWGKDLVSKTLIDWRDEAIKDIAGQTGIDPSNEITKFSREYAENTFKLIHPDNAKSLAGVFTDKMAAGDIRQLRQAAVDTFREGSLSGRTMTEMASDLQAKWDAAAGDMATNRFIDAAGKTWDNGRYTQMLVRTTVARTSREGYFNTLAENGDDLVIIMNVDGESCEICQAWDGVIVSITGANKNYPSYNQAIAAGWGHPNCRCPAERVDETIDADAIQQQADAETPDFQQAKGESDSEYRRRMTEEVAKYSEGFGDGTSHAMLHPDTTSVTAKASLKTPIEARIENLYPELSTLTHERFYVIGKDGKDLFKPYDSGKNGGNIPKSWIGKMKDAEFIHNHPSGTKQVNKGFGSSFSPADIFAAIHEDLAAIRAISAKREYIARPGPKGWPSKVEIVKAFKPTEYKLRKELADRISSGKIKQWQAEQLHAHRVWKIVAKKTGFEYTVVRKG